LASDVGCRRRLGASPVTRRIFPLFFISHSFLQTALPAGSRQVAPSQKINSESVVSKYSKFGAATYGGFVFGLVVGRCAVVPLGAHVIHPFAASTDASISGTSTAAPGDAV